MGTHGQILHFDGPNWPVLPAVRVYLANLRSIMEGKKQDLNKASFCLYKVRYKINTKKNSLALQTPHCSIKVVSGQGKSHQPIFFPCSSLLGIDLERFIWTRGRKIGLIVNIISGLSPNRRCDAPCCIFIYSLQKRKEKSSEAISLHWIDVWGFFSNCNGPQQIQ